MEHHHLILQSVGSVYHSSLMPAHQTFGKTTAQVYFDTCTSSWLGRCWLSAQVAFLQCIIALYTILKHRHWSVVQASAVQSGIQQMPTA